MDLPRFDHLRWIAAHEDVDAAHLDWSSVPAADPADLGLEPPALGPDMVGPIDGDPRLREAVAERTGVDPDQVLPTLGATEAVWLAVLARVDSGDRVAVETPTYTPLDAIPDLLGAEVLPLPRRPEDGFTVPVDDALDALDDGCRLVVLSNLHNPTGVGIADDDLERLLDRAGEAGAHVLVDEVYRASGFDATAGPAARHPAGISADSVTKAFGYGNVRQGWLVADPEIVEAARRAKDLVNPAVTPQGSAVARWVLDHEDVLLADVHERLDRNRKLVASWVEDHDVDWVVPWNGNVCAVRVGGDDIAFAEAAVDAGVIVVPGSAFRLEGWIRVAFGVEPSMLEDGLDRLGEVVDGHGSGAG